MAASTKRTETWGRWVGSVEDVASIASLALDEVNRRRSDDDLATARMEFARPGMDLEFSSPAEFVEEVRASDLAGAETLRIQVGHTFRSDPLAVSITWTDYGGVTMSVTGQDRAIVVGAAQVLSDRLREGASKRAVEPILVGFVGALLAVVVSFAVGLVRVRNSNEDPDLTALPIILGWGLVGYLAYRGAKWCFPRLELVPEGQPSRWVRVRKRVIATLVFLAAAVAGVAADRLIR